MHRMRRGKLKMLTRFLLILGIALTSGCGILSTNSKVIFVPESGGMVRIGKDVTGYVYTLQEGEWIRSPNKVRIPEGWYAGSLSSDK